MSEPRFDVSLPGLYKENWREAYRADKEDSPRLSTYQSPNGEPIPFIYKSLDFSGGQSVDTAEYPFFGLWSNEALNQKPQSINVHGYLRGEYYLNQRKVFIDALMIQTTDETPGFFDHPLWGRFKVVVESYNISETADQNGQCELSLVFKRAGVSLETRAEVLLPADFIKPEEAALTAIEEFSKTEKDSTTLTRAFGQIKELLLKNIGRLQAAQTKLNVLANEITSISNLIAQGIQAPMQLAQAFLNAVFSITGAIASIADAAELTSKYFSSPDNIGITLLQFLSASNWSPDLDAVTVKQMETKTATENLYRTVSLCAAAELLYQTEDITRNKIDAYWNLYTKLENSVDLENPDVYNAITSMRSSLSQSLRQKVMPNDLKKKVENPVSLLFLSHYLGCNDETIRTMNLIEDSLLVSGEVNYV